MKRGRGVGAFLLAVHEASSFALLPKCGCSRVDRNIFRATQRQGQLHVFTSSTTLHTSTIGLDQLTSLSHWDTLFDITLPAGRCLGVRLPKELSPAMLDSAKSQVTPEEVDLCLSLKVPEQVQFLGGRIAMRRALGDSTRTDIGPILRSFGGVPYLPDGCAGSISHKEHIAVALANPDCTGSIGVDVEDLARKSRTSIGRRVLTANEQSAVGTKPDLLEGVSPEEEILLRFSLKEALYKAIYPYVRRRVSFGEAEVQPLGNANGGTAQVTLKLVNLHEGPFHIDANWMRMELTHKHIQNENTHVDVLQNVEQGAEKDSDVETYSLFITWAYICKG